MTRSRSTHPDNSEAESYRFLWLRSFHRPVAVRVWSAGCERFVTLKELSGAGATSRAGAR